MAFSNGCSVVFSEGISLVDLEDLARGQAACPVDQPRRAQRVGVGEGALRVRDAFEEVVLGGLFNC